MKKLFALVMVLAMALAIAAPALASGWDELPTESPVLNDITVEITALETTANTSKLGSLYEQLSVMYPVVKGTEVHFYVEITIPAEANLSAANIALLTNKGLVYQLTLTNLTLTSMTPYTDGVKGTEVTAAIPQSASFDETNIAAKHVYGFEYWASADSGDAAVASAEIGFYNVWNAGVFGWDNDQDGADEFVVTHTSGLYEILASGTTTSIEFPVVESTGKIDVSREMILNYDGVEYAVNRAVNGDITFRNTSTAAVITPSDTGYAAVKAAFDSFFTALGFGYADANYMTEAHFTKYFGTIAETAASVSYPGGSVTVTEPTVNPPQTGDASTVAGFVMIALALVAAAAVTVRKVRA